MFVGFTCLGSREYGEYEFGDKPARARVKPGMEGYARWFHVSLGVGEGLCRVWSRLSTVLKGVLDLCFSGEERKSKHKHSSN